MSQDQVDQVNLTTTIYEIHEAFDQENFTEYGYTTRPILERMRQFAIGRRNLKNPGRPDVAIVDENEARISSELIMVTMGEDGKVVLNIPKAVANGKRPAPGVQGYKVDVKLYKQVKNFFTQSVEIKTEEIDGFNGVTLVPGAIAMLTFRRANDYKSICTIQISRITSPEGQDLLKIGKPDFAANEP